jgi:pyruvate/2-oxoglutarate dehydrogenase complex dihydrolipoamide acyltransferase (E2) component
MRVEVRLPQLSMGMSEAEIVDWLVVDGDEVVEGDEIVEVEAEKTSVMIPAPTSGVVREIGPAVGDVLEVRDLLCVIEAGA